MSCCEHPEEEFYFKTETDGSYKIDFCICGNCGKILHVDYYSENSLLN